MTAWRPWFHLMLLVSALPVAALGASQPRPFTGKGVLIVSPFNPQSPAAAKLTLYRDPGVGRIGEIAVARMPQLPMTEKSGAKEECLAVMGKWMEWFRLAYDDAGREGWVEGKRWWRFVSWEEFLMGRTAQFLPGVAGEYLVFRSTPSVLSPTVAAVSGQEELVLTGIQGDWALAAIPSVLSGWIRWRDGDGRFLISIGEKVNQQKH